MWCYINHSTYPCFWESCHLYVYTCTYAHVVFTSTWHLTHGLVNVFYRYLTALSFHENCQLVVFISCIWDVTIFLCFCGASGGSMLFTLGNPYIMELPRWLNICANMRIPTFGCAARFNPWYKNLISGLRSFENQLPCSWLIVKLLLCLWVKNDKWSHWKPFLWPTGFCWAVMFYFMAKPSALVILCELCLWTKILGGHGWQCILE